MRRLCPQPAMVVVFAGVTAALHIGKIPPAIPVLRDALGLSLLEAGFLLSIVQLAGMSLGVLAGLAAEAIGLRRSILIGLSTLVVASALGGWARDGVDLLCLRALEGCGFLMVVLPAPGLIRRLVTPDVLAIKLGFWGAYMPTGAALSLLAGAPVMAAVGWQGWWWLLAGISLIMAACVFRFVPSDRMSNALRQSTPSAVVPDGVFHRLKLTLTSPGPWLVAVIFALYSSQWLAVIGFLPSVYAQAGVAGATAGVLTAVASLVNVVGNVGSGRLLYRGFSPRHLLQVGFSCMALGAFLAFSELSQGQPILRYLAVLMFSAVGGMIPGVLFSLAVKLAPGERTVSTTVGWVQQCSAMGQFLGPPLVAWGVKLTGDWHSTWMLTGAASLAGFLLAVRVSKLAAR